MPKINTNLVDGLFNDESKKDTENTFKIVYVDISWFLLFGTIS